MTNNVIVGYYSIAAKIIEAIDSLFIPANNALYPFMSKLYHDNKEKFYRLVNKVNAIYLAIAIVMVAGALLFGKFLITFVNGTFDSNIYMIYSILSFKIIFAPFAPFFTNILINQNRKAEYLKIVKYTFIFNILLVPVLIYLYSGVGMAVAVLMVVTFHILLFYWRKLRPEEILELQS
jgi:PST family polysaccharide transporter